MEFEARYALVGAFVLASVGLLVFVIFWLSNYSAAAGANYYTVYFREQSLDGLQKDSEVSMKGVKVGRVKRYSISPTNVEEVKVLLELDASTPVKQDTQAVIQRSLLTGWAKIDLVGSTQDSALLTVAAEGEYYPVIPEGSTQLDRLAQSAPEVLAQVTQMTQRVNAILSDKNVKSVENILVNMENISGEIASHRDVINTLFERVELVMNTVNEAGKTLESVMSGVDKSVDEITSNVN